MPEPCRKPGARRSPAMERILAALAAKAPLSAQDIAAAAAVAATTLVGGGYLARMKTQGLIHIDGWRKNGNGHNAVKLPPLSPAEKSRRFRQRRAAEPALSSWAQQLERLSR